MHRTTKHSRQKSGAGHSMGDGAENVGAAYHNANESEVELELECRGDCLVQPDASLEQHLSNHFWTLEQPDASLTATSTAAAAGATCQCQ